MNARPALDVGPASGQWDALLDAACRGQGISSVFQPIVDTSRGTVAGYEALARFTGWPHGDPQVWFAMARVRGRCGDLEAAALRAALKARPLLPPNSFLALNVSPDMLSSPQVREVWEAEGDLGGLVIELTEQRPINSYAELEPDLERLRAAGALIAVDDAGSGYAGLHHLLALRPALIKLDRALIKDVGVDEARRALIEMLGTFASRIDAWILAEGVERAEELEALISLGVPLVQGFYLARPGAPWAGIEPNAARRLARHRPAALPGEPREPTVRDITESAVAVGSEQHAKEAFAANPLLESIVILGEHGRPVTVVAARNALPDPASPGLRVNLDTSLQEALARAMTRPREQRFDPLLVTDNAGRFSGLARLERMITALARRTGDGRTQPPRQ